MGWKGRVGFCIFNGSKWVGKGEWGSVFSTEANGLKGEWGSVFFAEVNRLKRGVGFCISYGDKCVNKGEWGSVFLTEINVLIRGSGVLYLCGSK